MQLTSVVVKWNETLNGYNQWLSIDSKVVSELHIGSLDLNKCCLDIFVNTVVSM